MLPYVFLFPQDPMPGPGGVSSGITHGVVYEISYSGAGAYIAFTPGWLKTDETGELSDLERFTAHPAIPPQRHGATWADIEASNGIVSEEGRVISLSATLLAAWIRYVMTANILIEPSEETP